MTETTTKTLATFIKEHQLEMRSVRIEGRANPGDNEQWERSARHFSCTLKQVGRGNPRTMTIEFSQGSAHTKNPTIEDVLDCLASDASGWDNSRSFEDWCGDYGYDTDSRRAERIYEEVKGQAKLLRDFLGNEAALQALYNCERL